MLSSELLNKNSILSFDEGVLAKPRMLGGVRTKWEETVIKGKSRVHTHRDLTTAAIKR